MLVLISFNKCYPCYAVRVTLVVICNACETKQWYGGGLVVELDIVSVTHTYGSLDANHY